MKKLACTLIFALMTGTICGISHADLADGVVAYWSFDAGSVEDDSGMGNHGIMVGNPKVVDGKAGEAFDFDGIDDGIEVPDNPSLQLPDALTVAAWIRPDRYVKLAGICWKGENIEAAKYNWRIASACKVVKGLYWGTANGRSESTFVTWSGTTLNEWNFVALTADGKDTTGYSAKEGAEELITVSQSSPGPYDVWEGEPVRIGFSTGPRFDGVIDEVVIYNRALSEAELTQLMNEGIPKEEMAAEPADEADLPSPEMTNPLEQPTTIVYPQDRLVTTWASLKASGR